MMRSSRTLVCMAAVVFGTGGLVGAAETVVGSPSDMVLEVARFDVDRENYTTKKLERAGKIPDETLDDLQRALLGEFTRAGMFGKVGKPAEAGGSAAAAEAAEAGDASYSGGTSGSDNASGPGVILSGTITDFKAGNRAARLLIGLGAGGQKFQVECVLKDRATGRVVGEKTIVDRKWGGLTGGDEAKGRSDFAEKVVAFVQKTLDQD